MDFSPLTSLHLLRPQWLWALLPLLLVVVLIARQQSAAARWRGVIAPHLLEHLVVRPRRGWAVRPLHLLVVAGPLTVVALAGPTWQQEPSPFTEDTAPLVIVLELTPQMEVTDVQPSRLERARQKVRDLAEARGGARTALLAYAGSAHTVVPLTDDAAALEAFVADLSPALMPVEGREPAAALPLASELLDRDGTPGTVLFVTAGIPGRSFEGFEIFSRERRDQLQILAVATEAGGPLSGGGFSALDGNALEALAARTGTVVTLFTVDDSDVERILRRTERHLQQVQQSEPGGRWRDEGWWLVWPVAAITLLWFRRGWLIRWEG
jgi:Ca-activated chloride channel family protein